MIFCNVMMTLLITALSVYNYWGNWFDPHIEIYNTAVYSSVMLLNMLILAWSVLKIRKTIKSLKNGFPNEKLIKIHLINSCLATLSFFLSIIFLILVEKTGQTDYVINFFNVLVSLIAFAFQLYMDSFLLYVIQRFTRREIRKSETDKVLGR